MNFTQLRLISLKPPADLHNTILNVLHSILHVLVVLSHLGGSLRSSAIVRRLNLTSDEIHLLLGVDLVLYVHHFLIIKTKFNLSFISFISPISV